MKISEWQGECGRVGVLVLDAAREWQGWSVSVRLSESVAGLEC